MLSLSAQCTESGSFPTAEPATRSHPRVVLAAALARAGWSWTAAWQFTDRRGEVWSLSDGRPPMLRRLFLVQWQETLFATLVDRRPHHSGWAWRRFLTWWRGRGHKDPGWTAKLMCVRYLAGKCFTRTQLAEWGYRICPDCPWCGQPDSQAHPVWTCPSTEDARAKLGAEGLLMDRTDPHITAGRVEEYERNCRETVSRPS